MINCPPFSLERLRWEHLEGIYFLKRKEREKLLLNRMNRNIFLVSVMEGNHRTEHTISINSLDSTPNSLLHLCFWWWPLNVSRQDKFIIIIRNTNKKWHKSRWQMPSSDGRQQTHLFINSSSSSSIIDSFILLRCLTCSATSAADNDPIASYYILF